MLSNFQAIMISYRMSLFAIQERICKVQREDLFLIPTYVFVYRLGGILKVLLH